MFPGNSSDRALSVYCGADLGRSKQQGGGGDDMGGTNTDHSCESFGRNSCESMEAQISDFQGG